MDQWDMGSAEYLHLRAPSGVFFGEFSHRNEDGPAESLAAGCAEAGSGMPEPDRVATLVYIGFRYNARARFRYMHIYIHRI